MEEKENKISYDKLFWLFIIGSVLGVLVEGIFCLIKKGYWESHVVSVFGAFNILYGMGGVLFYLGAVLLKKRNIVVKTIILMVFATVLELICGLILKDFLGMRAWNYHKSFLNYKGLICLPFTLIWGAAGLIFCLTYKPLNHVLSLITKKIPHFVSVTLGVLMLINLFLTGVSIVRWSNRHYHSNSNNIITKVIDNEAPDWWMQKRFMEWEFLDDVE